MVRERRLEPRRLADMNKVVTIPVEFKVPLWAWYEAQESIGKVIDNELDQITDQVWDAFTESRREVYAEDWSTDGWPLELYSRAERLPATATRYRGVAARYHHTGAGKWRKRIGR